MPDEMTPSRNAANEAQQALLDIEINLLLEGLYHLYGYDFRHYARSSIQRRLLYRMNAEGLSSITMMLDRVLHDPKMAERLLQDLSIRVTEMFRDPAFFLAFRREIVPKLRQLPQIRIWHAGCATGQEPLSMAILLHEEGLLERTKIYATDMNEEAIRKARTGIYRLSSMQEYTRNYIQAGGTGEFSQYYTTTESEAKFNKELLSSILYFQHNLVTDRSFNDFHVIICRNVLIYFDEELQGQVHRLFYDSLSAGGYLGLGSNESLLHVDKRMDYETVDCVAKIYRKTGKA